MSTHDWLKWYRKTLFLHWCCPAVSYFWHGDITACTSQNLSLHGK